MIGDITAAPAKPAKIRAAPAMPDSSSEKPCGSNTELMTDEKALKRPTYTEKAHHITQNSKDFERIFKDCTSGSFSCATMGVGGVGGRAGMKNDGAASIVDCFKHVSQQCHMALDRWNSRLTMIET